MFNFTFFHVISLSWYRRNLPEWKKKKRRKFWYLNPLAKELTDALRMAKPQSSFNHFECNRLKELGCFKENLLQWGQICNILEAPLWKNKTIKIFCRFLCFGYLLFSIPKNDWNHGFRFLFFYQPGHCKCLELLFQ